MPRCELYFNQCPNDHETTSHGSKPRLRIWSSLMFGKAWFEMSAIYLTHLWSIERMSVYNSEFERVRLWPWGNKFTVIRKMCSHPIKCLILTCSAQTWVQRGKLFIMCPVLCVALHGLTPLADLWVRSLPNVALMIAVPMFNGRQSQRWS